MSIKDKMMNIMMNGPKFFLFGISLAVTFTIGTATGMLDNNAVFAAKPFTACGLNCSNGGGS